MRYFFNPEIYDKKPLQSLHCAEEIWGIYYFIPYLETAPLEICEKFLLRRFFFNTVGLWNSSTPSIYFLLPVK
jgi:hypothetical protein